MAQAKKMQPAKQNSTPNIDYHHEANTGLGRDPGEWTKYVGFLPRRVFSRIDRTHYRGLQYTNSLPAEK